MVATRSVTSRCGMHPPPAGSSQRNAASISIDQFVAQHVGASTPFPVLNFGVQVNTHSSHSTAEGVKVRPMGDPITAFDRVFGTYQPMGGDPEQTARLADRRSVLDLVGREFGAIAPRLAGENRSRLEAHLTAVRELERRLSIEGPSGCQLPNVRASLMAGGWDGVGEFEVGRFSESGSGDNRVIVDHAEQHPMISRAHMDILFEAFRCDLTRVATIQWSNSSTYGIQGMPWLDPPVNQGNHDLSHDFRHVEGQFEPYLRQRLWYSEQIAYLLNRLNNEIDFDGNTMLDNTIVLHGSDVGDGQRHRVDSVPFLLAGSGGGYFRTGYTVDAGGRSQNDLLLSVSQAFGIDASTFGERDFNTGPIDELR